MPLREVFHPVSKFSKEVSQCEKRVDMAELGMNSLSELLFNEEREER